MYSIKYIIKVHNQNIFQSILKSVVRHKGHSKWQNIKHVKAEKDAERSTMFQKYCKLMNFAIAENNSADPNINLKLAQVIEEAKKKSMPMSTINGVLQKAVNEKQHQKSLLEFRGPGKSSFLLQLSSPNLKSTRIHLNTVFKKYGCVCCENSSSLDAFDHWGFVITDVKDNFDNVVNDAITIGAMEVLEIKEEKPYYKFTCEPVNLSKITNQLTQMGYEILTAEEEFISRSTVTLNDDDMKKVDALCTRLGKTDGIVLIVHNIDTPDTNNS